MVKAEDVKEQKRLKAEVSLLAGAAGSLRGVRRQRGPQAVPRCHLPGPACSGRLHQESNSSYVWPAGIRAGSSVSLKPELEEACREKQQTQP